LKIPRHTSSAIEHLSDALTDLIIRSLPTVATGKSRRSIS
jgi:hypothetical protein